MNHQDKQEIFDQYAKSAGYEDFIKIVQTHSPRIVMHYIFAACDLVQEEQQKRIADNATIDGSEYSRCGCVINENSITNPENLIK